MTRDAEYWKLGDAELQRRLSAAGAVLRTGQEQCLAGRANWDGIVQAVLDELFAGTTVTWQDPLLIDLRGRLVPLLQGGQIEYSLVLMAASARGAPLRDQYGMYVVREIVLPYVGYLVLAAGSIALGFALVSGLL